MVRLETSARPARSKARTAARKKTLSRERWIASAVAVLERRGIGAVKIDRLARQLRVTRGSFYFHFRNLADLKAALVEEWRQRNCRPFDALPRGGDSLAFFTAIARIWVDEAPFSPLLDLAIRDWSRASRPLAAEVADADALRISLLSSAFRGLGYDEDESLVRARITYFHRIGYCALAFKESTSERERYQPIYGRVLLGPAAA
jgi:AcrR family transcriptional regulator